MRWSDYTKLEMATSSFSRDFRRTAPLLLTWLALLPAGCEWCESAEPVPFKREAGLVPAPGFTARPDGGDGGDGAAGPGSEPAFEPWAGTSYPDGAVRVELDGGAIEVTGGSARAALQVDLDQDDDRDALVMVTGADSVMRLALSERVPQGFRPPRAILDLPSGDKACRAGAVRFSAIAPGFAVIEAVMHCPLPRRPTPASKPAGKVEEERTGARPAPEQELEQELAQEMDQESSHFWIVTLEAAPRLLDHLQVLAPGPGLAQGELSLQLSASDQDADGHADIVVTVTATAAAALAPPAEQRPSRLPAAGVRVQASAPESTSLSLIWLDRPGGLARDPSEPEASMAGFADRAARLVTSRPEAALSKAERALFLYALLCRESGNARLRVGDTAGLSCGRSAAAGRATAVAAAALVRTGKLLAALTAFSQLESSAMAATAWDRKLARDALMDVPSPQAVNWRPGPGLLPVAGPRARLPLLGFLSEDLLLVRGTSPFTYRLSDRSVVQLPATEGDLLIKDPSGRFAVAEIKREGDSYRLRVVHSGQIMAGVVAGHTLFEAVIPRPLSSAGLSFRPPAADEKGQQGGFSLLGWIDEGIVIGDEAGLLLAALDAETRSSGPARLVSGEQRLPSRMAPGSASPDGRYLALATQAGIAIVQTFPRMQTRLLRTEQWLASEARELAVSPSGERVALVRGGRVYATASGNEPPSSVGELPPFADAEPPPPVDAGAP